MADLKDFIRQRGTLRTRITLFEKFLTPLLNQDSYENSKLKTNELTLRLGKLQDLFTSFDQIQSNIEKLDSEGQEGQMKERDDTESRFFALIAQGQELLDSWKEQQDHARNDSSSCSGCNNSGNVKLPPITISPFDGDPNKWLEFRDTYTSLIHNNEHIDDINKFHYLLSYLEGTASAAIKSVGVSALNYSVAWSLLCNRFNNKRLLINQHLKSLFSIESLHKESDKGLQNIIDTISKNLRALNSLGEPTDKWDTLIIFMASAKLDIGTSRKWEEFRSTKDTVTLNDFYNFLRQTAEVLETINTEKSTNKSKSFIAPSAVPIRILCPTCKQNHKLYECPRFLSMSVDERNTNIMNWKLCSNCLRSDHQSYQCRLGGCRICKRKHNTLLHKQGLQASQLEPGSDEATYTSLITTNTVHHSELPNSSSSDTSLTHPTSITMSAVSSNQAILSTALIEVTNNDKTYILRALLDCCSQTSFISDAAQKKISCSKISNSFQSVTGLNNTHTVNVTEHCDIQINSLHTSFSASVRCFILPQITEKLPHAEIDICKLSIPSHIKLADPKFFQPSDIDLLLGADIFWDLIGPSKLKLGPNKPSLQETQLGWIVGGPTGGNSCTTESNKLHCHFSQVIKEQLSKFWELEEVPTINTRSADDDYCEDLFNRTTRRNSDGRFCVKIPLRESPNVLGDSYDIAKKRFHQIERKMKNKPKFRQDYTDFIKEYEHLGHLTEVAMPEFGCYLPHHAVIRENSETTKLRVVFDASAKTTSGKSFNDIQFIGPVVQDDLLSILLRFRQHNYVVCADIEKCYRQVLVDPDQRHLQMILWRDDESLLMKAFELNTVTYGTASAPFLSTRCLVQLAKECSDMAISEIIRNDFYVDDFLSGGSTESEVNYIVNSVTKMLKTACFPLRKFRSNSPSVFDSGTSSSMPKDFDVTSQSGTLGLTWHPNSDTFQFPVNMPHTDNVTKRSILSESSKLFDPLGLLSLCTITPKIVLQKLWLTKLDWDDPVSSDLEKQWSNFVSSLRSLSSFQIPRPVITKDPASIELHSFSDASQEAYAACIYLRSIDKSGKASIRLLCAKTKVAPLKVVTIPRLELCGALLSSRLCQRVLKSLRCKIDVKVHWTDSSVVLGWLRSNPCNLKTFVSNRVSEIQDITRSGTWRHVPGPQNPADLASRGVDPKRVPEASLWWNGPPFLLDQPSTWPQNIGSQFIDLPEIKPGIANNDMLHTTILSYSTTTTNLPESIFDMQRFSKFSKLQRTAAYVLRFIRNTQKQLVNDKQIGSLTVPELDTALTILLKQHQRECFNNEIKILSKKQHLPSSCSFLSLSPFIDETGLLRVGGRIQEASVSYTKKHPVLLNSNHILAKLIFSHEHLKLLHCGPQMLLCTLRNRFWPLRGRVLARSTVNNCKTCRIMKAENINPIMGNLPASRVTPNLPFQISGTDFAGPFMITDRKGRGCKITKCYLCLFVCFTTKALHLEVASDLTSEVFLLCLRRFISRRGKPTEIYCDNGTNFVGANNEISNFLKSHNEDFASFAASEGITFKFSPAYSPHFGGLWEAGVKSAKFHMVRMLGSRHFTFEELSTLFTQIEAILNSRPLTPLSSDPNDLNPLTPGHFLIGKELTSLPTPALHDINPNRLNRYHQIEQIRQHFWDRWRNEFLSELQQRMKWKVNQEGLQEGDMVVLKDLNTPPLKWRMGRIIHLYPGPDGISRVVDVKTTKGIVRRAVTKICPLPRSDSILEVPSSSRGGEYVRASTPL